MCSQPDSVAGVEAVYNQQDRQLLLDVAHRSILAALRHADLDLTPPNERLDQPRGAFTTLHLDGQLRGCVGYILAAKPLYRTVAEAAQAAALQDFRFCPVTLQEAERLKIEISVLSPLQPIRPEEVEIGRHGLVVSWGNRRGLLLPQVPVEHRWDRETFLEQTCLKAGLPADAWKSGANLESFTAEIFGDSL